MVKVLVFMKQFENRTVLYVNIYGPVSYLLQRGMGPPVNMLAVFVMCMITLRAAVFHTTCAVKRDNSVLHGLAQFRFNFKFSSLLY